MLVYNVTSKVNWDIAPEWVYWMKHVHIPQVMNTDCFISSQFVRILEIDDNEGPTYAIQYFAENEVAYNRYLAEYAPVLRQETIDKWGSNFIAFRSLMEVVE